MTDRQVHSGVIGVTDDGYPIVTEAHSCPRWAGGRKGRPDVKECWYCKYADFRKSTELKIRKSICRCPENRVETRLGFTKNEI